MVSTRVRARLIALIASASFAAAAAAPAISQAAKGPSLYQALSTGKHVSTATLTV
jgi:hypothetical protein